MPVATLIETLPKPNHDTQSTAAERKPNIVLIPDDDLGGCDVGCYGSAFHQTPHINAPGKCGMHFVNAYPASPLCSPTHSSLLTGLHLACIGINAPNYHLAEVMLEQRLAKGNAGAKVLIADSSTGRRQFQYSMKSYFTP